MKVYKHFPYIGRPQHWTVPDGVVEAIFECWGASGGMPSTLHWEGKVRQVVGGAGPANIHFTNGPRMQAQLGKSYANNSGYVAGKKSVNAGEAYSIYVGGNGKPGYSTIRLNPDGTYTVGLRGGDGGWNGGGDGGKAAHVHQNLYNRFSTSVAYHQTDTPAHPHAGERWYNPSDHLVKEWDGTAWNQVTKVHNHAVGPSGGGGGGATDIRFGGTDLTDRILVAGGGGGGAGHFETAGPAAWHLRSVPSNPKPPFGSDNLESGPTGVDHTWASDINFLTGGWGRGGMGGSESPTPSGSPTPGGGFATLGGSGSGGTARHTEGGTFTYVKGSGGTGGGPLAGGTRGTGGSGAHGGTLGSGGSGADATGGYDDFCAGGGGGGGGYYGGGGGGQGFKVTGDSTQRETGYHHTRGGGGGGGSNFFGPDFSAVVTCGCARPPQPQGSHDTGANGHGGFARISYDAPPTVQWVNPPLTEPADQDFDVEFTYSPAEDGGAGIDHYVTGTGNVGDTFPTANIKTIMVKDHTQTDFTQTFTAPDSGFSELIFVQVVDTDGDASAWLSQQITGTDPTVNGPVTITAPAAGSTFEDSAAVTWTVGEQTPLVGYRLGIRGLDPLTNEEVDEGSRLVPGGSRVNLAIGPGFKTAVGWQGSALTSSTDYPGVSGSCGKIAWDILDDGSAELDSIAYDNLTPGQNYHVMLSVASAFANDTRPVAVEVWSDDGLIRSEYVDLSQNGAGVYTAIDFNFTAHTQSVYFKIVPSGTGFIDDADPLVTTNFEDGTVQGWTAIHDGVLTVDTANPNSGEYDLLVTSASQTWGAQLDCTAQMVDGAGLYVATCYARAASGLDAQLRAAGTGVPINQSATVPSDGEYHLIRLPFIWDGTGLVWLSLQGSTGGCNYDDINVYYADQTEDALYGYTDSQQITYLADFLLELGYEGSQPAWTYFDGEHANGNPGTPSWLANEYGISVLTGTDVTGDTVDYSGPPLADGLIYVDALNVNEVSVGSAPVESTVPVVINPAQPAVPSVSVTLDTESGLVTIDANANDGAADVVTVSFDIFRNGVRIATGLTPDQSTRDATFLDAPPVDVSVSYVVRAWGASGGYTDQSIGQLSTD